jgi:hypothetical protein
VPNPPTFPISTVHLVAWEDPVIDELGHDPRSAYVERFWLGILGPSATWLMRRLALLLETAPDGIELDLTVVAGELGLGNRSGPNAPFVRCIERCCRFAVADLLEYAPMPLLRVRRKLPPLTRVQIERLPESLRAEHDVWLARPAEGSPVALEQLRHRARQLALSLLQLGEDGETTERQLHRWRVHPALAHEATAWAVGRHHAARAAAEAQHRAAAAGGAGPLDAA